MRPAGKGPLDSLYFSYPHFSARRVPELDGVQAKHPVAIVGLLGFGLCTRCGCHRLCVRFLKSLTARRRGVIVSVHVSESGSLEPRPTGVLISSVSHLGGSMPLHGPSGSRAATASSLYSRSMDVLDCRTRR